jgi:hypothetical protein
LYLKTPKNVPNVSRAETFATFRPISAMELFSNVPARGATKSVMEVNMETITLHNVVGISRLSGRDDSGCEWIQFEVDAFAEQEDGECSICGSDLSEGWLCLDGAEEVCAKHNYKCAKVTCNACGRYHL